jgi:hypothetical protein
VTVTDPVLAAEGTDWLVGEIDGGHAAKVSGFEGALSGRASAADARTRSAAVKSAKRENPARRDIGLLQSRPSHDCTDRAAARSARKLLQIKEVHEAGRTDGLGARRQA